MLLLFGSSLITSVCIASASTDLIRHEDIESGALKGPIETIGPVATPPKEETATWSGLASSVVALSVVTTRELPWQFLYLEAFGLIAEGDLGHSSCKGIQFNFTYPIVTIHGH